MVGALTAVSATIKGVSGLFKSAKSLIGKFKAKRKEEAKQFKEDLLGQAGTLGISLGNDSVKPNNPLGITTTPKTDVESKTSMATGSFAGLKQLGGAKDNKTLYYIVGGAVALFLLFKMKKK